MLGFFFRKVGVGIGVVLERDKAGVVWMFFKPGGELE